MAICPTACSPRRSTDRMRTRVGSASARPRVAIRWRCSSENVCISRYARVGMCVYARVRTCRQPPVGSRFATYLFARAIVKQARLHASRLKGHVASMQILITGGAGFIGSHLADALLARGHRGRALDSLAPQVHGDLDGRPAYLDPDVELLRGDVRDAGAVRRALDGVEAVYHFAAAVGVGQSMYEIDHYTSTNNGGTAVLLQALIERPVQRLVVASSMSLYGEGLYRDARGAAREGDERPLDQLKRAD